MTYDALLVVSYGGPRGPEDVLPFMRNATRGRGIPDERLVEVSGHYALFGGRSPINERNAELVDALRDELVRRGVDLPVHVGNRNWTPYLADTLGGLARAGARRVLCLTTAAFSSYSGCRQYREDLAGALAAADAGIELDKIGPYAETDGFVRANADALVAALRRLEDPASARVLFVTHSIPAAMDAASGPGPEELRYSAQHVRVAERVAALAASALGVSPASELVFCSRSGAPHIPWLEPDVNDRLGELAAEGVREVVTAPIGFINDHMEVIFDLDTQAAATASGLGLGYVRAATAGTHPAFVGMLADAVAGRVAGRVASGAEGAAGASDAGEACDPARSLLHGVRTCSASCCGSGRPGGAPLPAACGAPA